MVKKDMMSVFNSDGSIAVLIECKAPEVKLHATFDQIARYNMTLNADYLMVTE
jgi:hypothetical protein